RVRRTPIRGRVYRPAIVHVIANAPNFQCATNTRSQGEGNPPRIRPEVGNVNKATSDLSHSTLLSVIKGRRSQLDRRTSGVSLHHAINGTHHGKRVARNTSHGHDLATDHNI